MCKITDLLKFPKARNNSRKQNILDGWKAIITHGLNFNHECSSLVLYFEKRMNILSILVIKRNWRNLGFKEKK